MSWPPNISAKRFNSLNWELFTLVAVRFFLLIVENIVYPSHGFDRRRKPERRYCKQHYVAQFVMRNAFGNRSANV
jgi:hypothetical protein